MMSIEYFVMLNCKDGENITPLLNDETDHVAKFKGPEVAIHAAEKSALGSEYGYHVFVVNDGIHGYVPRNTER